MRPDISTSMKSPKEEERFGDLQLYSLGYQNTKLPFILDVSDTSRLLRMFFCRSHLGSCCSLIAPLRRPPIDIASFGAPSFLTVRRRGKHNDAVEFALHVHCLILCRFASLSDARIFSSIHSGPNDIEISEEDPDVESRLEDARKLLVVTHDEKAEMWHVDYVGKKYGNKPLQPTDVEKGYLRVGEKSR